MQIIEPEIVVLPTPFQIIAGGIILFLIVKFFIKEHIKYYKKKRQKPTKRKNDIKRRLQKANKKYYEKFNK